MARPLLLLLLVGGFGVTHLEFVCETVAVGNNLARGGKSSRSSSYSSVDESQAAIDGDRNTSYKSGSCSHNDFEMGSWWKVDLQELHQIAAVTVVNRQDCCGERLWGAEVRIGNSPDNSNPVCGTIANGTTNPVVTLCCCGMEGRYVSVVIPTRKEYLTLCEVEVYAAAPTPESGHGCW
ncbi:fucolectin-like [Ambystoma mexicanum]|uniref:fucolectin-like n=1 Tax=Ambystoma mexicanum TaxID=8296 RepID=UPI0037E9B1AF